MPTNDYPHDPGYEFIPTKTTLSKRLLCSPTEAGRVLASGELRPQKPYGYKSTHYRTEDLDRCRQPFFEKISAKFAYLRGDELAFCTAKAAEMSALSSGRTEPNATDRQIGEMAAKKLTANGARGYSPGRQRLQAGQRMDMKTR